MKTSIKLFKNDTGALSERDDLVQKGPSQVHQRGKASRITPVSSPQKADQKAGAGQGQNAESESAKVDEAVVEVIDEADLFEESRPSNATKGSGSNSTAGIVQDAKQTKVPPKGKQKSLKLIKNMQKFKAVAKAAGGLAVNEQRARDRERNKNESAQHMAMRLNRQAMLDSTKNERRKAAMNAGAMASSLPGGGPQGGMHNNMLYKADLDMLQEGIQGDIEQQNEQIEGLEEQIRKLTNMMQLSLQRQNEYQYDGPIAASTQKPKNLVQELQQLADLRKSGALTEEEFATAKQRHLGDPSNAD
jgi:hypothetical protein